MTARRFLRHVPLLASFLAAAVVSACGWMEVPYERSGARPETRNEPRTQSRSEPRSETRTTTASSERGDAVFIGADAVTVGRGDTLYAISRRHQVPVRALIAANNLSPPYVLRIGDKLVLPRTRHYTVIAGDTLSGIAETHRVSSYELARINGIEAPYVIHAGEKLALPEPQAGRASARAEPGPEVTVGARASSSGKSGASVSVNLPARAGKAFAWPVKGDVVSGFGPAGKGQRNDGINIRAKRGTAVRAAENGVVAYAGAGIKGYGILVLVRHEGGWITAYAHADSLKVEAGDEVRRGQVIASVGSTGGVSSPQLHFEIRKNGKAVDPRKHLG